jgi:hypothetical protein
LLKGPKSFFIGARPLVLGPKQAKKASRHQFLGPGTQGFIFVKALGNTVLAPKPFVPVHVLFGHRREHIGSTCIVGPRLACLNPSTSDFLMINIFEKNYFKI